MDFGGLFDAIANAAQLARTHQWVGLVAALVFMILGALKSDRLGALSSLVNRIPSRYLYWVTFGLGIVGGVANKLLDGGSWTNAVLGGIVAAIMAMGGHDVGVEGLRRGKEIVSPKALPKVIKL